MVLSRPVRLLCLTVLFAFSALPLSLQANAPVPGFTPGEFAVTETGAASYTIPIAVPPGTAGMEPALSLNYSSQGASGPLGVGWTIGGLSVITRCSTTLVQDGFIDGVNFNANDRFCIDGLRLIAIDGEYGADGTEYRTEIDGFTRVISYGSTGGGPEKFKVWTKAGQIMEYGYTSDSRIEAQGQPHVFVWAANKISDTTGNYLTISYTRDAANGTYYLDRIDYTGNDATSPALTPYNSVQFLYEARDDINPLFAAGSMVKVTQRLTNIQTYVNSALVKNYQFDYDNNGINQASRLIEVRECDSNSHCLPGARFEWQQSDSGLTVFGTESTSLSGSNRDYIAGDWNGSGQTDLLSYDNSVPGRIRVYHADGNGSFSQTSSFTISNIVDAKIVAVYAGDWNGDGKHDIAVYFREAYFIQPTVLRFEFHLRFYISNGSGFSANGASVSLGGGILNFASGSQSVPEQSYMVPVFGDWNGDGRTDLFLHSSHSSLKSHMYIMNSDGLPSPTGFEPSGWHNSVLVVGDWNGNGKSDLARQRNSNSTIFYHSTGTSMIANGFSPNWSGYNLIPGDWNGDGSTDLFLQHKSSGVSKLFLSNGSGSMIDSGYNLPNFGGGIYDVAVGDWNGDGMSDLVFFPKSGSHQVEYFQSAGTSLHATGNTLSGWSGWSLITGDFNGDSLSDNFFYRKNNSTTHMQSTSISGFDYVAEITNGLGRKMTITYDPLTDTDVYTKGSGATFPEVDVQIPAYVVTSVETDYGIGGVHETTYRYTGARMHVHGRGFLGFASMEATDTSTGIVTTTEYEQAFPFASQTKSSETRLSDGTLISRLSNTWDALSLNGDKTVFPYVVSSVSESYEVNDGPGNQPIATSTNSTTYDNFGNALTITETTSDGTDTFSTETVNTYVNDTNDWFLGRLTRAEVTQTNPDSTSATRVSAFAYDSATGLLNEEIIEPDLPAFTLTTTYQHDPFGNRVAATVSGNGITPRATITLYDARGQFAIEAENALGHVETRTYDARYGVATSLTGPNGLTTTWLHDDFGRQTGEVRADGTSTQVVREWCDGVHGLTGHPGCPAGAVLAVTTHTDGAPTQSAYSDAFGRVLRTEVEGFDGTPIYNDTVYDHLGQVERQSRPYFAGATPQWHEFVYDAIGRGIEEIGPDSSVSSVIYDGFSVTTINALGQTNTQVNNARGELIQVIDADNHVTDYRYDPHGNLLEVEDAHSNITSNVYDIRGQKIAMDDPDMGQWTYQYNVLGELVSQTDAKGQTVTMTYDALGRLVARTELEGTSTWTYDTATMGIGKLASVSGAEGDSRTLSYDAFGRPHVTVTTIDSVNYSISQSYDLDSRLASMTYPASPDYPTGLTVEYHYNAYGYLFEARNQADQSLYWQAEIQNAEGQLTRFKLGNGVTTQHAYDPTTGFLTALASSSPLGTFDIQDQAYSFDMLGNLTQRQDVLRGLTESFTYDDLNRLTESLLDDGSSQSAKTYAYDAIGNLTYKSDVGTYLYGQGAGPHAVTQAGSNTYTYDLNGNMIAGAGRTLAWTSYNKPYEISQGATTLTFHYDADRSRFKQTSTTGPTRIYVGGVYEKEISGSLETHVHYIQAGGSTVAIYKSKNNQTEELRYLHRDHLGSITTITDDIAQVVEEFSYDPHGKRRHVDWSDAAAPITAVETVRGFTGHEYLDDVGLIHMNGRVYDPELGRFLSADPFVQEPYNPQNLNRYTYVNNNPLSYTDPSGFFFKKIFKAIGKAFKAIGRVIKAVVKAIKDNIQIIGAIAFASIPGMNVMVAGFGAGLIASGGDLKAGIIGALTAGAFYVVGHHIPFGDMFGAAEGFARSVAHGIVGGASQALGGGDFLSGFLSGFATQGFHQLGGFKELGALTPAEAAAAGQSFGISNYAYNATIAAVVGGTASVIGGGKFGNGALTGAFSRMFNDFGISYEMRRGAEGFRRQAEYNEQMRQIRNKSLAYENRQVFLNSVSAGAGTGMLIFPQAAPVLGPMSVSASIISFTDSFITGNVSPVDYILLPATTLPVTRVVRPEISQTVKNVQTTGGVIYSTHGVNKNMQYIYSRPNFCQAC